MRGTELGMRQHCRASVTMFSRQKTFDYFIMSTFVVATTLRHRSLNSFSILSCPSSSITLSRCREAKNLTCAQL